MHRQILGDAVKPSQDTDHKNGNALDNRRANLRPCTRSQNLGNSKPHVGRQFKGVSSRRDTGAFRAYIKVNYRQIALGCYGSEEDAARAYDLAALEHFGDFARLNFPDEVDVSRERIAATYKRPPLRLDSWQQAQLVRAREEIGLSFARLSKAFGISASGANKVCLRAGVS